MPLKVDLVRVQNPPPQPRPTQTIDLKLSSGNTIGSQPFPASDPYGGAAKVMRELLTAAAKDKAI